MSTEIIPRDDLTRIDGIGTKLEARLNARGIETYQHLSIMSASEIAAAVGKVAGLDVRKIEQMDWAGQARELAVSGRAALSDDDSGKETDGHSSKVIFSVELLLNKENQVRGTTMLQCKTSLNDSWAGWSPEKMIEFMVHAGRLSVTASNSPAFQQILVPAPASSNDSGILARLFAVVAGGKKKCCTLRADQPFDVELEADTSKLKTSPEAALFFTADIYARQLGSHLRTLLGQVRGKATPHQPAQACLKNIRLSEGIYRFETVLTFGEQNSASTRVSLQGDLLQVYATGIRPSAH